MPRATKVLAAPWEMAVSWSTPGWSSGSKAVRRVTVAAEQILVAAGVPHRQSSGHEWFFSCDVRSRRRVRMDSSSVT